MIPRSVSLVHHGCARNLIDSELILARMADEELCVTGEVSGSHAVVLNTCSFIGEARTESEASLQELLELKRAGEVKVVVVAGCLVQRYRRNLRERFPEVDLFAEISDYRALASAVRDLIDGRNAPAYLEAGGMRSPEREGARLLSTPGSYAYLRISHGCDHTCSFCAIPGIRGTHRSKRMPDVLYEAQELAQAGVRELILVAEDSTAWGREHGAELPDLVEALAEIDDVQRVRVMYAYPNNFPWRLTELLREHPRVVPYLDIPVQHAATSVLRAMRRAGSGDAVRRTLDRLIEEVPGITIRTTMLVGFPGESEADVDELCGFIRDYGLTRLGAFAYSDEEGTPAFDLEHKVPAAVAQERLARVLAVRDENLTRIQSASIGEVFDILIDEHWPDRGQGATTVGRGEMDAPEVDLTTLIPGEFAAVGESMKVRIVGLDEQCNWIAEPASPVEGQDSERNQGTNV